MAHLNSSKAKTANTSDISNSRKRAQNSRAKDDRASKVRKTKNEDIADMARYGKKDNLIDLTLSDDDEDDVPLLIPGAQSRSIPAPSVKQEAFNTSTTNPVPTWDFPGAATQSAAQDQRVAALEAKLAEANARYSADIIKERQEKAVEIEKNRVLQQVLEEKEAKECDLRVEVHQLIAELLHETNRAQGLAVKVLRLTTGLQAVMTERDQAESERDSAVAVRLHLEEEHRAHKLTEDNLTARFRQLEDEFSAHKSDSDHQLESLRLSLEEEQSAHAATRDSLTKENVKLKGELETYNAQIETLRLSLEKEQIAHPATKDTLTEATDHLKSELEAYDAKISKLVDPPKPTRLAAKEKDPSPSASHPPLPVMRPKSPAPSVSPSDEQNRTGNVRKLYVRVKQRWDNLLSIVKQLVVLTHGMNMANFGEIGGLLKQLKVLVQDAETESASPGRDVIQHGPQTP
ncbi:hypothetical protein BCR34DRAFT_577070 [Clohesyomyces aquaticus]|uniref:Uncharacterized protein n=1 Tax=Clohesyomyces aquaticus TaxID=1231657 RepID=A0A1Y1YKP7_9PLEO|nr:hypothetical protein BCR34DRAFT_577070 [Clohesyomyces aquaticus]